MKIAKLKIENLDKGFTIIETMIAISVFIVVVMAGMGALLNANLIHQKSQDMRSILDNLSFIMEDISRNLRTGSHYQCFTGADALGNSTLSNAKSCENGWAIAFEPVGGNPSSNDDQVIYYITGGGTSGGTIMKSTNGARTWVAPWVELTPEEVDINPSASSFSILGAEPPTSGNNKQQPLVIIRLVGSITYKGVVTPFSLQTSVSQRNIDI